MTPAGIARLKADEGCKMSSYPDPLSPLAKAKRAGQPTAGLSGTPWTIGYGATGDGINASTCWTKQQCDDDLAARIAAIEKRLKADLPWTASLDPVRRDVLVNVAYNVGADGLEKWTKTLGYFAAKSWPQAADALRNEGAWNRQVGLRAERLARATETGVWV